MFKGFEGLTRARVVCPELDHQEDNFIHGLPAPTRWEGNTCVDWGLVQNVEAQVKLREDRWSDHKLLAWSVLNTEACPRP